MIIIFVLGLFLILLAIYVNFLDRQYKKYGKKVKARVKKIEALYHENGNDNKNLAGYNTTFVFEYNNVQKEETILSERRFKDGSVYNGIYLEKTNNKLIPGGLNVGKEGFYKTEGAEVVLVIFGLFLIFLSLSDMLNWSTSIFLLIFIIFVLIIFGFMVFNSKTRSRKTKEKIRNEEPEFSTVEGKNLRRVKVSSNSVNLPNWIAKIFIMLILGGLGITNISLGVSNTIDYFYKLNNWSKTTAILVDMKTKTSTNNEGDKVETKYVVHEYKVNGKNYKIESKKSILSFSKINDKNTVFYDNNNPSDAYIKERLGEVVFPILSGVFFVGLMIYVVFSRSQKIKLLNKTKVGII